MAWIIRLVMTETEAAIDAAMLDNRILSCDLYADSVRGGSRDFTLIYISRGIVI